MINLADRWAFPMDEAKHVPGMTYREYLVGQIAAGALRMWTEESDASVGLEPADGESEHPIDTVANCCVLLADAIIAELEKGGG